MVKRMLVMLVTTALIVGALGFVKFRQIQSAIGQAASFQPPPEAVTTITAVQEQWPETLSAIASVAAVQGVTISADLPGTVDRIGFDAGQWVREGEVLALLDTRQEQAQLAAAEAQRELARVNFERMQGLLNENVVSRAEFDRAQNDSRAVLGGPRHPPRQPRSIPLGRRCAGHAAVPQSDLRELRCAAAGDGAGAGRTDGENHRRQPRRPRVHRTHHRD
jgi:multidrug efflux pump subunit AcrA (membrane-fusion protein)